MLGGQAVFKATGSLWIRYQATWATSMSKRVFLGPLPPRRLLHSTPVRRGLLGYLVGDHHHARVHKEIGLLLEDYDNALTRYYANATEAVSFLKR